MYSIPRLKKVQHGKENYLFIQEKTLIYRNDLHFFRSKENIQGTITNIHSRTKISQDNDNYAQKNFGMVLTPRRYAPLYCQ